MDQNNGPEAKIFKEETRALLMIDLGEVPLLFTRISLPDPTLHIGKTIRTMEDHMITAQTHHSIETMEIDLEMYLSTIRIETGGNMETFLVLHRLKGETIRKIVHIAEQEVISPTTLLSAVLTIDPRLALRPTNKSSRKIITRRHLMWLVSPQPTIPLANYQISAR